MKAAVLESYSAPLVMHDLPMPVPSERGAVIRVQANGICRSDWHAWKGHWPGLFPLPHVLGHEMAGLVEDVGSQVVRFRRGDRVIVPFIGGDGVCDWCQLGLPNLCNHPVMPGFRSWGAYGEFVAIDHADYILIRLPESMTFKAAAGMGCRYMTAFHAVIERARATAGEWLVVYGCGGVGLSVVEIAASIGAAVIAVDIGAAKLEAAQRLGAVAVLDASNDQDTVEAVLDLTSGGAHVGIDALGSQTTCANSVLGLRKRGRHVQIGMTGGTDGGLVALPMEEIVSKELAIYGARGMPAHAYTRMLQMVAGGRLQPERLVNQTVPIEEAGTVLASMDHYATLGFTVIDSF